MTAAMTTTASSTTAYTASTPGEPDLGSDALDCAPRFPSNTKTVNEMAATSPSSTVATIVETSVRTHRRITSPQP